VKACTRCRVSPSRTRCLPAASLAPAPCLAYPVRGQVATIRRRVVPDEALGTQSTSPGSRRVRNSDRSERPRRNVRPYLSCQQQAWLRLSPENVHTPRGVRHLAAVPREHACSAEGGAYVAEVGHEAGFPLLPCHTSLPVGSVSVYRPPSLVARCQGLDVPRLSWSP